MKTMPAFVKRLRKRLALGEEAVARMHGLGARLLQASTILSMTR